MGMVHVWISEPVWWSERAGDGSLLPFVVPERGHRPSGLAADATC